MIAAALLVAPRAWGADHLDSPGTKAAAEADITDVYAWVSADKAKTNLILNVSPAATGTSKFSNAVQYVFHVSSQPAYGESDPSKIKRVNIVCTFRSDQTISCWLGPAAAGGITTASDYVTGDASATAGLTSLNGKMKVFAGLRNDPFFFNLEGFQETVKAVVAAAAAPGFAAIVDASGCPHLPADAAALVAGQLSKAKGGGTGVDFFAGLNVLSIVVSVDTAELTSGGPVIGVWGSTHRRP
jgi:hypothetical protein